MVAPPFEPFVVLQRIVPARHSQTLVRVFAAAAVSCYYWYRLPALFGFGPTPGDGMLVDLRGVLPAAFATLGPIASTALFVWWLLLRPQSRQSWSVRPPLAAESI